MTGVEGSSECPIGQRAAETRYDAGRLRVRARSPPRFRPRIRPVADPLISLDTEHASAQPGGQARVTVTITNPGTVVEGYRLQVLGPAVGWAEVVPPEVSVYPQQEVTAA